MVFYVNVVSAENGDSAFEIKSNRLPIQLFYISVGTTNLSTGLSLYCFSTLIQDFRNEINLQKFNYIKKKNQCFFFKFY